MMRCYLGDVFIGYLGAIYRLDQLGTKCEVRTGFGIIQVMLFEDFDGIRSLRFNSREDYEVVEGSDSVWLHSLKPLTENT